MKAKRTGAMNVTELIKSLQNAKDQDAEVILTDTEGSFSVGILTVEECGDGEVLIVAEPHPQL